jgi:hypothetical protein
MNGDQLNEDRPYRPAVGDEVVLYPLTGGSETGAINPRLWGKFGRVAEVHDWGALVLTEAAGWGQYRAAWSEMVEPGGELDVRLRDQLNGTRNGAVRPIPRGLVPPPLPTSRAKDLGYTGSDCTRCGSSKVRWNGSCQICEECGESSGCS